MNAHPIDSAVLDAIRDPLLVVRRDGRVVRANAAAHVALEVGETLERTRARRGAEAFDGALVTRLLQRHESVRDLRLPVDAGDAAWTVDVDPLDERAGRGLFVVHVRRAAGSPAEYWRDEMISLVSHELRNPLSAMKHSVDILLSQAPGALTEGQRRFLDTSGRSIDRLARIVDGFLDVSRIRSGAFEVQPRAFDVPAFVTQAVETFRTLFNVQRVSLEAHVDRALPSAWGDPARLEQVLVNLLSNACKFTPEGGRVSVVARPCGREAMPDALRVMPWDEMGRPRLFELVVQDTGLGMSGETLETLFRRFGASRSDATDVAHPAGTSTSRASDPAQGAGGTAPAGAIRGAHLGMNISRTLVEALGGWMDVESELGRGTTVRVRLPLDRHTHTLLTRVRAIERRVADVAAHGEDAVVVAVGKFSDERWDDIVASWRAHTHVNPDAAALGPDAPAVWTFNNAYAIAVVPAPDADSARVWEVVSPRFVECEDDALVYADYAVGVARVPEGGPRVTSLVNAATRRMRRARDAMARTTLNALDARPPCLVTDSDVSSPIPEGARTS